MKRSNFTENQILGVLKELEGGMPAVELSRKYGIGISTIYSWRSKYAGMTESELKKLNHLEKENQRLKQMYAELSLDNKILKDVIAKKL